MNTLTIRSLFDGFQWHDKVCLSWDDTGEILSISPIEDTHFQAEFVVPGFCNTHSHSFQRLMAGRAEGRSSKHPKDSFWTWRETMYHLVNILDETDHKAIARYLYLEMLQRGFTSVCEFHYVHFPSPSPEAVSQSLNLCTAARDLGLRMNFLPVLYQRGGFEKELNESQIKFSFENSKAFIEYWKQLYDSSDKSFNLGLAFHSLRACKLEDIHECLSHLSNQSSAIHIHISEQPLEVEDCLKFHNKRPVDLLFDEVKVDGTWNLVHATHINQNEIDRIVENKVNVVLCPITEANLGDGIFPLASYLKNSGIFSIGSDSHVRVDPFEELRFLEYSQRYQELSRTVCTSSNYPSTAEFLINQLALSAKQASGFQIGCLKSGYQADFLVLNHNISKFYLSDFKETILDQLIFNPFKDQIQDVYVGGKQVISRGLHGLENEIEQEYLLTLKKCFS